MDSRRRAIEAYLRARDGSQRIVVESDETTTPPPGTDAGHTHERSESDAARSRREGFEKTAGPVLTDPSHSVSNVRVPQSRGTRSAARDAPDAVQDSGSRIGSDAETADRVVADVIAGAISGVGAARAARLLLALGTERAAPVLRLLGENEVNEIARALLAERDVPRAELDAVLAAIGGPRIATRIHGGPDVARSMLRAAFGDEEGERWFFRCVPNAPAHHFAFLNDFEPHQIHVLTKDESVPAAALVLAHVERGLAAKAIALEPPERRAQIARRIARMGQLSRDVVVRVEEAVREKIRVQGRHVTQGVDGPATLAAILRHVTPSASDAVLRGLREANVDLEESIRAKLYTTELLLELSDRHLADLLREFSDMEVAIFLKGKDENLRARVLRAVSDRRALAISEEYAHIGARRREEVDEVTNEILERMRALEEDGSILVPRDGDRYI